MELQQLIDQDWATSIATDEERHAHTHRTTTMNGALFRVATLSVRLATSTLLKEISEIGGTLSIKKSNSGSTIAASLTSFLICKNKTLTTASTIRKREVDASPVVFNAIVYS